LLGIPINAGKISGYVVYLRFMGVFFFRLRLLVPLGGLTGKK
jgi:hypothetical protein